MNGIKNKKHGQVQLNRRGQGKWPHENQTTNLVDPKR